jgi:hypothetical protein
LYLFLEKPVPDDGNPNNYKLNATAYKHFYMYKLSHTPNPIIQYAFELLNSYKQLQLPSKKYQIVITNYQVPITSYKLLIIIYQVLITNYQM